MDFSPDAIVASASSIAKELTRVVHALDANIFRIDNAADRGGLFNIQRAAHDAAIALSQAASAVCSNRRTIEGNQNG
jgi:hypothetical protein